MSESLADLFADLPYLLGGHLLLSMSCVLIGVLIITRGLFNRPRRGRRHERGTEFVSAVAFMSGVKKSSNAQTFRGGDLTAVMGGVEIDLRQASMEPGSDVTLDTLAFWGGIEIVVPVDWAVTNKVLPLLGGSEDKSRAIPGASKQLLVRGTAIMGGVTIANPRGEG